MKSIMHSRMISSDLLPFSLNTQLCGVSGRKQIPFSVLALFKLKVSAQVILNHSIRLQGKTSDADALLIGQKFPISNPMAVPTN